MTTAYPLYWPEGWTRTPPGRREKGQFKTSYDTALNNVATSLRLFGKDSGKPIGSPIMSSNIDLLTKIPADPGIAVWFTWDGEQRVIPVDRYTTPAANLQAIHHVLEARRIELRHGTLALVRATFKGFKALEAPGTKHWTEVLGLTAGASAEEVSAAFRRLAGERHPDRGGSAAMMAELTAARDRALREIGDR